MLHNMDTVLNCMTIDRFPAIQRHRSEFGVVFTTRGPIHKNHKAILHINYNCSQTIKIVCLYPNYVHLVSMHLMSSELNGMLSGSLSCIGLATHSHEWLRCYTVLAFRRTIFSLSASWLVYGVLGSMDSQSGGVDSQSGGVDSQSASY